MLELRPYQADLDVAVDAARADGARNVLATSPTGSGKTVLFSHKLAQHRGAACAIAHRQELVSQISLSLAKEGVRHSIIGPRNVVKLVTTLHREEYGGCWYDPQAPLAVAGIDTLVKRGVAMQDWCQQVTFWVLDEAHHLLAENKWGAGVGMFPNAWGLGVTATPCRADGKGLGRHADGLFDALVEGPGMRDLINQEHLSDYQIFAPPGDLDVSAVPVSSSTGDFNQTQLRRATKRSHLVGDVVKHYLRLAPGKLGITFATDVEDAGQLAAAYNAAGVPAAVVSAKTPARERHSLVKRFRRGDLRQLVNVDIFGEGFDLPALEVISFARPTASYPLYCQQFGRGSRPFEGKEHTVIIDHVSNVVRHNGPPDVPRAWSLDRRESRRRGTRDPDVVPYRTCIECTRPFEATRNACPFCAAAYTPGRRDGPEFVEGDLVELDAETLARMRGEVTRTDEAPTDLFTRMRKAGMAYGIAAGAASQHRKRQEAQGTLRGLMELYGGLGAARGRTVSESQRRFWFRYGMDVLSAQALGRRDAENLALRMISDMGRGVG